MFTICKILCHKTAVLLYIMNTSYVFTIFYDFSCRLKVCFNFNLSYACVNFFNCNFCVCVRILLFFKKHIQIYSSVYYKKNFSNFLGEQHLIIINKQQTILIEIQASYWHSFNHFHLHFHFQITAMIFPFDFLL